MTRLFRIRPRLREPLNWPKRTAILLLFFVVKLRNAGSLLRLQKKKKRRQEKSSKVWRMRSPSYTRLSKMAVVFPLDKTIKSPSWWLSSTNSRKRLIPKSHKSMTLNSQRQLSTRRLFSMIVILLKRRRRLRKSSISLRRSKRNKSSTKERRSSTTKRRKKLRRRQVRETKK